ncbi:DUF3500 domain-containing protein [Hyphobacterium sp. CCMP332]|uniref:DUF3500 domain-containing protein n=1 Tax=Hyphobacterium sp. CCMP332 TaxID=2749086 RepID=UPI00165068C7|nr:DUF3500 domain-containing protein [Hyphobacterium sp. CCMP332]QNL17937.1 DUF3500 domain-containing protein [Hyphobacterium sp. CCMP332]
MKHIILIVLGTILAGAAHAHPDHADAGMRQEAAAMAQAAGEFLATLDEDQRARVLFDLGDTEAREGWSNLPTLRAPRVGLQIATLNAEQRVALHGLLARSLSSEGYGDAMHIMSLESLGRARIETAIAERGEDMPDEMRARAQAALAAANPENYWIRIFGDPASGTWSLVLDGHHLAVTSTVVDGRITFAPVFLGNNPQTIPSGAFAGRRSLQHELDRVADLMASLDESQLAELVQSQDRREAADFAGPGWVPDMEADAVGLSAADLSDDQMLMLHAAIREFIGVATMSAADARLAQIETDGLESLHLAWWGDHDDLSEPFMLRISGPSLHIDFAREGQSGDANHFHIVIRDPSNDYGENWLQAHYEEAHAEE